MRKEIFKNKKEVGYDMKNKHSMRKRVFIWAIMPVVMVVMMVSVGGCRKTITGPKPPDNGNEIDYPFNVSHNAIQSYTPRIAIDKDFMNRGETEHKNRTFITGEYSDDTGMESETDTLHRKNL